MTMGAETSSEAAMAPQGAGAQRFAQGERMGLVDGFPSCHAPGSGQAG